MIKLLIAVLSGALLTTAFAPLGWWFVAFISPAILMMLWQQANRRQAIWIGYAFGLGFFSTGVSWVYNSIHEFGHAPVPFAVALTVLFSLTLAVFPAFVGWVQAPRQSTSQSNQSRAVFARYVLIFPAIWVLSEWVRGWLLTGFPWLQLGYSQLDTFFSTIAPVAGVLSGSWVIVVLIGFGFWVWSSTGKQRVMGVFGLLVLPIILLSLARVEWTDAVDKTLDVRLIQGNIAQENKWQSSWLVPTIDLYVGLTEENLDADLVVWPEVALPGRYSLFEQSVLTPLQAKLTQSNTDLMFGVLRKNEDGLHNALVRLNSDTEMYLKRHLVPFGEYIPFRNSLTWLKDMVELPSSDLSAGKVANTLSVGEFKVASSICYEDAYGSEVADMLPEANFLVNVSNDAWFGDSLAPHQHLEISRMRALETGRPLLRATSTGISAIVDHRGQIQSTSPQFELHVLKGSITPRTGATPYVIWQDKLIVILMLISLGAGLLLRRR
ncbi:MAG TPA: apolipoprotein N-acyltransferase [Gammaproteobacteria bacterium]|nr:apolipoprotein N-acyltransferase [Gammaproteobacteria bacterium]